VLNQILEQSHQKPQNIQNLKMGIFGLNFSFLKNRKKLNAENLLMKIQYNLNFENKNQQQK
jgi:hypothetical protein